jgi:hypothetical protein
MEGKAVGAVKQPPWEEKLPWKSKHPPTRTAAKASAAASGFYGFVAASKCLDFSEIGIAAYPLTAVDNTSADALNYLR